MILGFIFFIFDKLNLCNVKIFLFVSGKVANMVFRKYMFIHNCTFMIPIHKYPDIIPKDNGFFVLYQNTKMNKFTIEYGFYKPNSILNPYFVHDYEINRGYHIAKKLKDYTNETMLICSPKKEYNYKPRIGNKNIGTTNKINSAFNKID